MTGVQTCALPIYFGDLIKMGASEQEALAMTAMASMDQHRRALEFAQQRITGATEKGALQKAISQLDFQRGKLQLDIDMKNAANYVAMNRARGEGMAKSIELLQKMEGMDPETQKLAFSQYESLTKSPDFNNAKTQLEAVARVRSLQREIPLNKQKELWDSVVKGAINDALTKAEVKYADKGDVVLGAVARVLSAKVKDTYDPDQIKMLNFAQRLVNTELKNISGGSVTNGESVRNALLAISGVTRVTVDADGSDRVLARVQSDLGIDVRGDVARALASRWQLLALRGESLSLEEIFLKLTGEGQ